MGMELEEHLVVGDEGSPCQVSWALVQAVTLQHGIAAWSRAAFWVVGVSA